MASPAKNLRTSTPCSRSRSRSNWGGVDVVGDDVGVGRLRGRAGQGGEAEHVDGRRVGAAHRETRLGTVLVGGDGVVEVADERGRDHREQDEAEQPETAPPPAGPPRRGAQGRGQRGPGARLLGAARDRLDPRDLRLRGGGRAWRPDRGGRQGRLGRQGRVGLRERPSLPGRPARPARAGVVTLGPEPLGRSGVEPSGSGRFAARGRAWGRTGCTAACAAVG